MALPTAIGQERSLSSPEDKESRIDTIRNGIPVGIRLSGHLSGSLQDAFILADARPGIGRPGELETLFRRSALACNTDTRFVHNSAVARVLYIPSDQATISKDKLSTIGTGDAHALIISIDEDKIDVRLVTENHHASHKYFSTGNAEKRLINRRDLQTTAQQNVLPEQEIIDIAPLKKSEDTRMLAVTITDGAFKGIDNHTILQEDLKSIKEQIKNITRNWLDGENNSLSELADLFVKNARSHGQNDCIAAVAADVTHAGTDRGVLIGVVDGARGEGGGKFAQNVAITISDKAKEGRIVRALEEPSLSVISNLPSVNPDVT